MIRKNNLTPKKSEIIQKNKCLRKIPVIRKDIIFSQLG